MMEALGLAAVRGSLLLLVAAVVNHAWPTRHPALRHTLWVLAIASQLALPLVALTLPQHRLPVPGTWVTRSRDVVDRVMAAGKQAATPSPAAAPPVASVASVPRAAASAPDRARGRVSVPALVWAAGAMLLALRFLAGTAIAARDTRRARRVTKRDWILLAGQIQEGMQLRRTVEVLIGGNRAVPYAWGVLSPVVCLPADADQWSPRRMRIVLIHEFAHIERFDTLTEVMAQVALVIFWFNPLLWMGVRRMRAEREHACDGRVLMEGIKPSAYVEELVEMMKSIGKGSAAPALGAIAMARRSQFEDRMMAVLDERGPPAVRVGRRRVAVFGVTAASLLFLTASVRPTLATPIGAAVQAQLAPEASTWGQSGFDELVDYCKRNRPKFGGHHCEVRNVDLASLSTPVRFEGRYTDGVIFRSQAPGRSPAARVLVRTEAESDGAARALAALVATTVVDGGLESRGPSGRPATSWWTMYEVVLPRGAAVQARSELGQIQLRDFTGTAQIASVSGPLQVLSAAGDISGSSDNGPVYVGLGGDRWVGRGLDLQAQNGPVYVSIPARYSAHLDVGTTNGPLDLTYPVHVRRMNSKRIRAEIGEGGPTIRVTTVNGSANIR